MSNLPGILYVVATPIGNLGDLSPRALEILGQVDLIAAEDTRHTARLLSHFGLSKQSLSLHEHNEEQATPGLIKRLQHGQQIALVSDAGTPLLSDPGYRLIKGARQAGIVIRPVPGANAAMAALCVSGLPTDRFVFEGFLPAKSVARQSHLQTLERETRTVIFYESTHRIVACIHDLCHVFGGTRHAVIARELTKTFEQVVDGPLEQLVQWLQQDPNHQRGEFVILVAGAAPPPAKALDPRTQQWLTLLLAELPLKKAVALVAQMSDTPRNVLYAHAIDLKSAPTEER